MTSKVDMAFNKLLKTYKKKEGGYKKLTNGKLVSTPGWVLDRAYGGVKVAEKRGSSSAEYDLFDNKRRSPSEFVRWVDIIVSSKKQK